MLFILVHQDKLNENEKCCLDNFYFSSNLFKFQVTNCIMVIVFYKTLHWHISNWNNIKLIWDE